MVLPSNSMTPVAQTTPRNVASPNGNARISATTVGPRVFAQSAISIELSIAITVPTRPASAAG